MDYFKHTAEVIKNSASEVKNKVTSAYRKANLQSELKEMYETLGKIRYSEIKNKTVSEEETNKITEEIDRLNKELNDDGNNFDLVCSGCGETVPSGSSFCPHCGEKLS